MSKDKVEAILNWLEPKTLKEVQSFLGFVNYYRKFIGGYKEVAKPLTNLIRKCQEFIQKHKQQKAFNKLKKQVLQEPIFIQFDLDKETTIEVDVLDIAIGRCISQEEPIGKLQPIAYYSRKLTRAKLNYMVQDKELLAIVEVLKKQKAYLEGTKYLVKVFIDHKVLTMFTTTKQLNRRQVRQLEMLLQYNFQIFY